MKQHSSNPKQLHFVKRSIFFLIPFLLMFCLLEIGCRLAGYKPLKIYPSQTYPRTAEAYFWVNDPKLGFRNRPNGSYYNDNIKGHPLVTTDELGFRNGVGWEADKEGPIILLLGDSIVFGAELNDDETVASEIAKLAGPDSNIRVLNAGIRGANTVQAKRMLEECLDRFPSIRVILYVYCFNDYPHNLNPYFYMVQAPTMRLDDKTGTIHEVEAQNPPVPWGSPFWVANPKKTDPFLDALVPARSEDSFLPRRFANFFRARSALLHQIGLRVKRLLSPMNVPVKMKNHSDEATVLKDDYPRISRYSSPQKAHKELFEQFPWAREHGGDEILEKLLREMNQLATFRNATFIATSFSYHGLFFLSDEGPAYKEALALYREFPLHCSAAGVTFIDITPHFTGDPKDYMVKLNSGGYNEHYGPKGSKTFAEAIWPEIRDRMLHGEDTRLVSDD